MARNISRDRTELFTVVGAPYVPEHHTDSNNHYRGNSNRRPTATGVASVWLVFYVVIVGFAIYTGGGRGIAYVSSVILN